MIFILLIQKKFVLINFYNKQLLFFINILKSKFLDIQKKKKKNRMSYSFVHQSVKVKKRKRKTTFYGYKRPLEINCKFFYRECRPRNKHNIIGLSCEIFISILSMCTLQVIYQYYPYFILIGFYTKQTIVFIH